MVAEMSHLTVVKMIDVCHLGFLKIYFFQQLISSGELICVIVQNFSKICQTVLEISQFFDFQHGRRPPSWIFKSLIFLTAGKLWRTSTCAGFYIYIW